MTQYSLMQIRDSPELVKRLKKEDFKTLWELAVKTASQYTKLCSEFEQESVKRIERERNQD